MIIGIGTDIVEVDRIKSSAENYGKRFLDRIFTETEQEYSEQFKDNKYQHYAARFAAKESFSKAIGTGLTRGFKFKEVGIKNERSGKPTVILEGGMKQKWGHCKIEVSLSHTDHNAIAYLVMESRD